MHERFETKVRVHPRGAHIYLEGKLKTEEWTDKTTGLKKIATRVVVINFDVIKKGEGK